MPLIWYKNQRVLRTGLQATLAAVPVLVAILLILAAQWPVPWLVAASLGGVAVQTVLSKIMALESVNAWLIKFTPFGSEPQR